MRRCLIALVLGAIFVMPGVASAKHHHKLLCQHKHGHTILHKGQVRVFSSAGTVYGCVKGKKKA